MQKKMQEWGIKYIASTTLGIIDGNKCWLLADFHDETFMVICCNDYFMVYMDH